LPASSTRRPPRPKAKCLARDWALSSPGLSPDGTRWYIRFDGYTRAQLVKQAPGGKPEDLRGVSRMRG
jgi:hypothetical protein